MSDEEERVLAELEAQLASDHVANRIRDNSAPRAASTVAPALLSVGCLLVTVLGFVVHVAVAVLGFVGLVASLVTLVKALLARYVDDSDHIRYY